MTATEGLWPTILPDGKNLNSETVKAGYAWWIRRYAPDDREKRKDWALWYRLDDRSGGEARPSDSGRQDG
jgi:hypothetical protein